LTATDRGFRTPPRSRHTSRLSPYPARAESLQQLLGTSIDENRQLTERVRRLEAELRGSSAELAKLRGQLLGAVQDALTDPLTGLANRRSFDLELRAVAACAGRSSLAHLVMADIDHFKRVSDNRGHDIGDEVLRIVGEVLFANVRRDSLVARVGGDEFGVLLPRASPHYTAGIATRLCELLATRQLVLRGCPEVVERVTLSFASTSPVIVLCLRSPLRADTTSARSPDGHTPGVADILRGQQWMGSPLRQTLGPSGAVRLIEVSAGRATRLLQVLR
jgi:diguanylate cyclase